MAEIEKCAGIEKLKNIFVEDGIKDKRNSRTKNVLFTRLYKIPKGNNHMGKSEIPSNGLNINWKTLLCFNKRQKLTIHK